MEAIVTGAAGFLLAVLWFDLMFDVQARRRTTGVLAEPVLASIAAYYRRVTTDARPMNRLVGTAMLVALGTAIVEVASGDVARWASWPSLALVAVATVTAATRTVPRAVRLGARRDPVEVQSTLARAVLRDHLILFVVMAATIALQVAAATGV